MVFFGIISPPYAATLNKSRSVQAVDPPRRRGRPARDLLDVSRTIAWFFSVAEASGLHLRELDRRFGSGTTGAWSKYRHGQLSPRPERLEVIEQAYPGTRRYFDSPFWLLIHPDNLGHINPRAAFEWLMPPLRERFVLPRTDDAAVFWRRPGNLKTDLQFLLKVSEGWSLDAGTAITALMHEAILLQDTARFSDCFLAWILYLEARLEHRVMLHVPKRLFDPLMFHVLDHLSEHVKWLHQPSSAGAKTILRLQKLHY